MLTRRVLVVSVVCGLLLVVMSGCGLRQAPGLMLGGDGKVMPATTAAAQAEQEFLLRQRLLAHTTEDWLIAVSIDREPQIDPRAEFIRRWWWDTALVSVELSPVVAEPSAYDPAVLTATVQDEMAPRVRAGGRLRVVIEERLPRDGTSALDP